MTSKEIYADEFLERFMTAGADHIKHQLSPVKIFKVSEIAPYIKSPTPPFLLGYNLIVYISEGHFTHQIGANIYRVQAPAILINNYGSTSAIKSVDPSAKGHCVLVKESAMTSVFREQEILHIFNISPLLDLKDGDSQILQEMFNLLYDETHSEAPYNELVESILKTILLKIIKLSSSTSPLTRREELAIQFKQLVHKNFKQHKQISFYADQLAVSANYLNRCVFSVFKKSSKDVIQEVTIMNSQFLLQESSMSIADISYELEFADPSYFARIFKKIVGVSPTEYRNGIFK